MRSFHQMGVAQIAPNRVAQIAPNLFRDHDIEILLTIGRNIKTSQGCSKRLLAVVYAEAADLASSFAVLGRFPQIWASL